MRRLVDGEEHEFPDLDLNATQLEDRLLVRTEDGVHSALAVRQGDAVLVSYRGRQYRVEPISRTKSKSQAAASGELRAPMPGTVVAIPVTAGQQVQKGAVILVLEAMKTQQPFVAPFDAVVDKIAVQVGENVAEGSFLAFLSKPANDS